MVPKQNGVQTEERLLYIDYWNIFLLRLSANTMHAHITARNSYIAGRSGQAVKRKDGERQVQDVRFLRQ
jgi:hypothetical protein